MLTYLASVLAFSCIPAVTSPGGGSVPPESGAFVIRAERLLLGDGSTLDGGSILVDGGRIQAFGKEVDAPASAGIVEHKGWISAGLVALHSYSGAPAEMSDTVRPVLGGHVAWAFDPEHPDFSDAVAAGITSLVLTPPAQALSGGNSAIVKSAGGRVLSSEAQLCLSFSSSALSNNRFPTSHAAAEAELDRCFREAQGAFARARDGGLPVLFEADDRPAVQRILQFSRRHKLKGAIYGADWIGELAEPVRDSRLGVIFAPLDAGADRRTLQSIVKVAGAGIPFGFGLDSPWKHPESLRLGAALCRREGLDAKLAWRALSSQAAELVGAADRIGRIEKGLDADLVLWSGDPLDLKSRVEAVYVDGRKVFEAKKP